MFDGFLRKMALKAIEKKLKEGVKNMKANYKTTTLGVLSILGAVVNAATSLLNGMDVDWAVTMTAIIAGWGLLHAADAKK